MKTKEELEAEIIKLRERLSMAVIFEVAPHTSIGLSEEDNLWRIRRDTGPYTTVFLTESGVWEEQPPIPDEDFADRTGYFTIDEAMDCFDKYSFEQCFLSPNEQVTLNLISTKNILKNN